MKKYCMIALAFLCLCCEKKHPEPVSADATNRKLDSLHALGYFEGFSVAVVDKNGVMYSKGVGKAGHSRNYTDTTPQPVASISKTLIGIALMKAQELDKLRLDDPIDNFLPFRVRNPNFPNDVITIWQLATHTSSLVDTDAYLNNAYVIQSNPKLVSSAYTYPDNFQWPGYIGTMEGFLRNILTKEGSWYSVEGFLKQKPGARFEYSNIGAALAALVIEKAVGMPYDAFAKKHILEPLKMNNSGWPADRNKLNASVLYDSPGKPIAPYSLITYPDGGFISSPGDMGKYLAELIKGYNGKGTLLTKESYRELFRPQLSDANFEVRSSDNPYNEEYNTGIFMGMSYKGFIGHTGGDPGICSMMFFDPATGTGRFLMANTSFSTKEGNDAFYAIWDVLADRAKSN